MKALSIQQPWAWAILHAGKDIENRSWPCQLRGRIVIHAGKKIDEEGLGYLKRNFPDLTIPDTFDTGAFIGEATITGCVRKEKAGSRWAFGPWCFTLTDVVAYSKPIPGRGQLGFFESPDFAVEMIGIFEAPEELAVTA